VDEGFNGHCFVCMVSRDVLEYLAWGKRGAILYVRKERAKEISMLPIDVIYLGLRTSS
jgi:hypothetical protein